MKSKSMLFGRVLKVELDQKRLFIFAQGRVYPHSAPVAQLQTVKPGDWVRAQKAALEVLTPYAASAEFGAAPDAFFSRVQNPAVQNGVRTRRWVEKEIRAFFTRGGFEEVRTPLLVRSPGMEIHIRPFGVSQNSGPSGAFLPTSPEFAMKKLLVGGLEKIFQISPCFRDEPISKSHLPEFTMLEWYRSFAPLEAIMADTENLVAELAQKKFKQDRIVYGGKKISVKRPWPKYSTAALFKKYLNCDLAAATTEDFRRVCTKHKIEWTPNENWDDLYFKLFLNKIEPSLPTDHAFFITDYPPSQAALAEVKKDSAGNSWARRFEAYAGGFELANAFQELTDPEVQRARFVSDMRSRTQTYGESFLPAPIDEEFIEALREGMPPASGIALGVDRLILLFADETDISNTFYLKPFVAASISA